MDIHNDRKNVEEWLVGMYLKLVLQLLLWPQKVAGHL